MENTKQLLQKWKVYIFYLFLITIGIIYLICSSTILTPRYEKTLKCKDYDSQIFIGSEIVFVITILLPIIWCIFILFSCIKKYKEFEFVLFILLIIGFIICLSQLIFISIYPFGANDIFSLENNEERMEKELGEIPPNSFSSFCD